MPISIETISKPNTRIAILLAVILIQLSFIGGITLWNQMILSQGEHVFIRLPEPVDPPSLFRGNYVELNYSISRIELYSLGSDSDKDFEDLDTIWVKLTKRGEWWETVSVHHDKPEVSSGQVVIKGKVRYSSGASLDVDYGIEQYFIPQEYEEEANKLLGQRFFRGPSGIDTDRRAVMGGEVVIHSSGRARVVDVLIGGVSLIDLLEGRASEDDIEYEPAGAVPLPQNERVPLPPVKAEPEI